MDHEQMSLVAARALGCCENSRGWVGEGLGGRGWSGGGRGGGEEPACPLSILGASGAGQPIVPHLGKSPRQHVLEKAPNEVRGRKANPAQLLGAVVAIAEGDLATLEGFDSSVGPP